MLFRQPLPTLNEYRQAIINAYRMDEDQCVEQLLVKATLPGDLNRRIQNRARELTTAMRQHKSGAESIDSFLTEYDLSNEEGIALMCLAEALMRIPDKITIDRLIKDKLTERDWQSHLGQSDSHLVNAATYALMLTGKYLNPSDGKSRLKKTWKKLLNRTSEPFIRKAIAQAMKILSRQFVMGRTMSEATSRAKSHEKKGYCYSYDMLGEAARTPADAEYYFKVYKQAIEHIAPLAKGKSIYNAPAVSVKLSALHPRYEFAQYQQVLDECVPRVFALAKLAKSSGVAMTIDAEEADRLDLSLDIFERVFSDPSFDDWNGLGLAIQAYQKRGWYVIDWLQALATQVKKRAMVRLIKGAYWDTEIKLSQMDGLDDYPVFTRKSSTDLSYTACVLKLLKHRDVIYPQFATHNAYTVATVLECVGDQHDFEFQRLHGMGANLYDHLRKEVDLAVPFRVYAPVGSHEDLLPYLMRRLLENGANSSFVNRMHDATQPIDQLLEDPIAKTQQLSPKRNPLIPLPKDIFGQTRRNSEGVDLSDPHVLDALDNSLIQTSAKTYTAAPKVGDTNIMPSGTAVLSPADHETVVGMSCDATTEDVEKALTIAKAAQANWANTPAIVRANMLRTMADLCETHRDELISLAIREAGKTIHDALSEVREAVDFCRYYAAQAEDLLSFPATLPGYTGELNTLGFEARGTIVCISPWNFPLAIFLGQVTAALVTGNCVIAKPAEQTPLMAAKAVELLYKAGVPREVLHFLPGPGEVVGDKLIKDKRIDGVVFTGSTNTARLIAKNLNEAHQSIVPLIAETGGMNAMLVDSSALPEQVVADVLQSAFGSAGQRCSACRILFVQNEVADKMLTMLQGALSCLKVGNPQYLETDVGPVIDAEAKANLEAHIARMNKEAKLIASLPLPSECDNGTFVAPHVFHLKSLSQYTEEQFGPILHVITYAAKDLAAVIDDINQLGYGLTFGIHSRINSTIETVVSQIKAGNCYVNRNMIGAVVGVQPFGGRGLSGTGPKAGGPDYLRRFCTEKTVSVNTTAVGGNATLMNLSE
jgi:RHH-type transcriptional regulator, proline utilization regulon repressor / proline dehydrogenase / delta 1-pyrroline-5-carboxylate dehydrogenase